MMQLPALLPGLLLPAACGWLLIRCIEGRHPVFLRMERWALSLMIGLLYGAWALFVLHITLGIPFNLVGFAVVWGSSGAALLALFVSRGLPWHESSVAVAPSPHLSKLTTILWSVLIGWVVIKALFVGATFLLLTPTYLDDSLDNWNLRGKLYFVTERLELTLPNEDPAVSRFSIGSYPPGLPLIKTWLADAAGAWSDPLVNSIHILWYAASLILVYGAIRRHASHGWALLSVYILGSLPLFLMHGTNAYADAFLAAHVAAAALLLFHALHTTDHHVRWRLMIFAVMAAAILPFAKNEGLLVYLPPLVLIIIAGLLWKIQRGDMTVKECIRIALLWGGILLLVIGPWLGFKWAYGLTFGNAKGVTGFGFGWQENVVTSIFINTFFEGNWLLLFPLLFALLVIRWRKACNILLPLTAFFLIVYGGQIFLYLFTSLSTEALKQTGYARGLIHLAPIAVVLAVLLLKDFASWFLQDTHRP